MRPITLITSAAYVNAEIAAEYGLLPPSFLPIGHDRLIALQIEKAAALPGRIVVTLPQSFEPTVWDLGQLRGRGAEVLFVPDGLTLGESVAYALAVVCASGPVRILHGDTVFLNELPTELDLVSVESSPLSYSWGVVDGTGRFSQTGATGVPSGPVLTGYFSFASGHDFRRALAVSRGNFLEALNIYSSTAAPLRLRQLGEWLDCGHLQTYYRSRAKITTARAFNSLKIKHRIVEKSSSNEKKARNEASWFEALPPIMRLYAPLYLGSETNDEGVFSYRTAYEHSPTLHELFVFGHLGQQVWQQIFHSAFEFLDRCAHVPAPVEANSAIDKLVTQKTPERLLDYARTSGIDLDDEWTYAGHPLPSLTRIAEISAKLISESTPDVIGLMHGDFCFPNIFYDFREQSVKVIDPRGSFSNNEPSMYGDLRYDLAKLNHSIEGYDFILANRFVLDTTGERSMTISFPEEGPIRWLGQVGSERSLAGHRIGDPENLALTIHLFLSMIPLHADKPSRQKAFLANALRLFVALDT
ncbi:aminoglycoside phosphotransferase family protein [Methylobacterium organophilum]|uniref:Capsular biosynthesis protein n=1 Tax=Methylobacterium organophilum TaxID=410 RepID=A0ABQ4TD33_METOR|nr:aminoglycoside phosphotransferase family protein [Methylobacterium organophilum]GJE28579.1 hypothetical protein LKMONMHP_3451 [Methylobacterium organophilum]